MGVGTGVLAARWARVFFKSFALNRVLWSIRFISLFTNPTGEPIISKSSRFSEISGEQHEETSACGVPATTKSTSFLVADGAREDAGEKHQTPRVDSVGAQGTSSSWTAGASVPEIGAQESEGLG